MFTLPNSFLSLLQAFASLFSRPVFEHFKLLAAGAILAPGKRTVTSVLTILGLTHNKHFSNYHRVLNRDRWSPVALSKVLVGLLIDAFAPGPRLVLALDPTLERRRGKKIRAKGVYHDSCRSSKSFEVKSTGLRWIIIALVVPISWASRLWALPLMTALSPSKRFHEEKGRQHQTLLGRAQQMMHLVARWVGSSRRLVWVMDSEFCAIKFLYNARRYGTVITVIRMDAALHRPASKPRKRKRGRPRKTGKPLAKLDQVLDNPRTRWRRVVVDWYGEGKRVMEIATGTAVWTNRGQPVVPLRWVLVRDPKQRSKPRALCSTDVDMDARQILVDFISRWPLELTIEESRAHLGVQTQRQHNDKAIARSTPLLFGLYSLVALLAQKLMRDKACTMPVETTAWYAKSHATFSDTLAFVRQELWNNCRSHRKANLHKIPDVLFQAFTRALSYA